MKRSVCHSPLPVVLLALLFVAVGLARPADVRAQDTDVVDEIVAVVGDEIILRSEVDALVANLAQQQQMPNTEGLWMNALGEVINQHVLTVEAKRDTTIEVTDDQVQQALDQRIDQMTQQIGGEARLEEVYGKSLIQIRSELREDFRDRLLAEQLQQRKLRTIRITPSEVEAWFDRIPQDSLPVFPEAVRVAHIVRYPEVSPAAEALARQVITSIRDSVVNDRATLEEMAQQFSDDPGSAQNGGRYEGSKLGELDPDFAAVASRLPIGELSDPFKTQFGLHILRVDARRGDEVDFSHILIEIDDDDTDPTEAIEYLTAVRDSIETYNAPFELMARRHSEEAQSAQSGGRVLDPRSGQRDLPLQALGPQWQSTLRGLEKDDVSEPAPAELLDGRRAYHIVKLQRHAPEHRVSLQEDYERIEEIALQEKQNRVLGEWLEELRKDVYIDVRGKGKDFSLARSE